VKTFKGVVIASTSITIAPAPRAALWALSAVILLTTPATSACSPPPALLVDTYDVYTGLTPQVGHYEPKLLRAVV
jgi:hypothetical protein